MGPFPLVVEMMARGMLRACSALRAVGIILISGSLVVSAVLGLGCDRGERTEESPSSAAESGAGTKPADRTGQAAAKAGKSEGRSEKAKAAKETAEAPKDKAEAPKAETGKRTKKTKGAAPPPAPVIPDVPVSSLSDEQLAAQVEALRRENARLGSEVAALEPKDPYILINTTLNRLSMKRGDDFIVKEAVVSTGSNTELVDAKGQRRWFFSTPKGVHTVKRKMVAPIWVKPDWAFVEEGEPVPGAQAEARFEEGTLGKYGLYFGNGYIVHGTLFQRFLGQSVTHGCVRVGDADLETVYANASVGTKIYIY